MEYLCREERKRRWKEIIKHRKQEGKKKITGENMGKTRLESKVGDKKRCRLPNIK